MLDEGIHVRSVGSEERMKEVAVHQRSVGRPCEGKTPEVVVEA
ncbi:hypothetical protein [Sphingomonas phyllosphaerae]